MSIGMLGLGYVATCQKTQASSPKGELKAISIAADSRDQELEALQAEQAERAEERHHLMTGPKSDAEPEKLEAIGAANAASTEAVRRQRTALLDASSSGSDGTASQNLIPRTLL